MVIRKVTAGFLMAVFFAGPHLFAYEKTSQEEASHKNLIHVELSDYSKLSGNAVREAEQNAIQSLQNELSNNVAASSELDRLDPRLSAIYPKDAAPDVSDSYRRGNKLGPAGKENFLTGHRGRLDREPRSKSTVVNSLSGSSSLPAKKARKPQHK